MHAYTYELFISSPPTRMVPTSSLRMRHSQQPQTVTCGTLIRVAWAMSPSATMVSLRFSHTSTAFSAAPLDLRSWNKRQLHAMTAIDMQMKGMPTPRVRPRYLRSSGVV